MWRSLYLEIEKKGVFIPMMVISPFKLGKQLFLSARCFLFHGISHCVKSAAALKNHNGVKSESLSNEPRCWLNRARLNFKQQRDIHTCFNLMKQNLTHLHCVRLRVGSRFERGLHSQRSGLKVVLLMHQEASFKRMLRLSALQTFVLTLQLLAFWTC